MRGFPGFIKQPAAAKSPASISTPAPIRSTLPSQPAAAAVPAARQVTMATVTRNLQSVLGPASNLPQTLSNLPTPNLPQPPSNAPQQSFPGFVSRQFDQVKHYAPAASNQGHLNNLASMFASAGQAAPERRNQPRTAPPRPAHLPAPTPRPDGSLLQVVKMARLGKLARAKAERVRQQAHLAKNQSQPVVLTQATRPSDKASARPAPPKPALNLASARSTPAPKPPLPQVTPAVSGPSLPSRPQTVAPRPQPPATLKAPEQALLPPQKPLAPPEKNPIEPKKPQLSPGKPKLAAEAATTPPKTLTAPPAGPSQLPQARTELFPSKPEALAQASAPTANGTVHPQDQPQKKAPPQDSLKINSPNTLPQLPKFEFKPIPLPQAPEIKMPQKSEIDAQPKAATPQQRNDLAEIKVSNGLNEIQRSLLQAEQRQPGERERLPLIEQAGPGFAGQGGSGQGGGQHQGRRRQDEQEQEEETHDQDAFEGGAVGIVGLEGHPKPGAESQDRPGWHLRSVQPPADLKLEMDWLSGPASALSCELREANQSLRDKQPPSTPIEPESDQPIKAPGGRGQGKFSEQAPPRQQQQGPRRERADIPEGEGPSSPDHLPDLSGLCSGCGIELGPNDPQRCPLCLKAQALATLAILTADANFIAYRVFLTCCRQPVASRALYHLRDFTAVPRGAYRVRPLAA